VSQAVSFVFGRKMEEVSGEQRKMHSEVHHSVYSSHIIKGKVVPVFN
jgi:hypothetical protein